MRKQLPIFLALLAIAALACQSSLVADTLTESGGVLFQDDFSEQGGGWYSLSDEFGAMDYDSEGFRMWIREPSYDFWSTPGLTFGDVRIEADATKLGGPDINRLGLICRYQDAMNYYFFIISSDGFYALGKVQADEITLLGQDEMQANPAIEQGGSTNHLRADCIGQNLTFYVNGLPVASASDNSFADGDVGITAGAFELPGVDILFDNFVVLKP